MVVPKRWHGRTPAAQRGQPRREGPDYWPTPACLTTALVRYAKYSSAGHVRGF